MNTNITKEYFMGIAAHIAQASTCRATVGCIIVRNNYVLAMGYVGSVHGDDHCHDEGHILVEAPYRKGGDTCIRTIHAEMNAVLKCQERGNEKDGWLTIYCTHQPCMECTKVLLQIGAREIWYMHEYEDARREMYLRGINRFKFHQKKPGQQLLIRQMSL